MPSSRRTPRRRKRLRADMESAPTVNGRVHDQPGNRNLVAPQTHVGDDACIVPGTLLHRKVPGRDKSLPYKPSETTRQTGTAATTRAIVGRDALIQPDPTAAQTPAGGYGIRPYGRRRMRRPTGKLRSRRTANPCRGRCLHRPADPASPQGPGRDKSRPYDRRKACTNRETAPSAVSQTSVGADSISAREPCGGAKTPGGINPAPTNLPKCPAKPDRRNHPGGRRAGCPHPAGPCGGARFRGRIRAPPLHGLPAFRRGGGGAVGTKI